MYDFLGHYFLLSIISVIEWIMVIKVSCSSSGTSLTTEIWEPLVSLWRYGSISIVHETTSSRVFGCRCRTVKATLGLSNSLRYLLRDSKSLAFLSIPGNSYTQLISGFLLPAHACPDHSDVSSLPILSVITHPENQPPRIRSSALSVARKNTLPGDAQLVGRSGSR